jgi:hypothetical protein
MHAFVGQKAGKDQLMRLYISQVADVKQKIETSQGAEFPAVQQVVIYQGKVWLSPALSC